MEWKRSGRREEVREGGEEGRRGGGWEMVGVERKPGWRDSAAPSPPYIQPSWEIPARQTQTGPRQKPAQTARTDNAKRRDAQKRGV